MWKAALVFLVTVGVLALVHWLGSPALPAHDAEAELTDAEVDELALLKGERQANESATAAANSSSSSESEMEPAHAHSHAHRCGDGRCEWGETCVSCARDCGACKVEALYRRFAADAACAAGMWGALAEELEVHAAPGAGGARAAPSCYLDPPT